MTPAAPSIPESPATAVSSTPAGTAIAPSTGTVTSGTPAFDAILMLQNLAATPEYLNTEVVETDLPGLDDSSDDEDYAEELEASLAFLSQLLTVTASRHGQGAQDFEAGGQSAGDAQDGQQPVLSTRPAEGLVLAEASETPLDGNTDGEAMSTAVRTETPELRAAGEAPQNLARAAEILSTVTRSAADVEKTTLATPARDPRWADELGARVSLMVRARESTASLQLTPVDLGPVEVNVTVKDSQATVHFGASQADTRALLEAAMPRLREMLAAQGFQLTDSSVSSGFSRSQGQERDGEARAVAEAETSTTESRVVRSLGLLDLYA